VRTVGEPRPRRRLDFDRQEPAAGFDDEVDLLADRGAPVAELGELERRGRKAAAAGERTPVLGRVLCPGEQLAPVGVRR